MQKESLYSPTGLRVFVYGLGKTLFMANNGEKFETECAMVEHGGKKYMILYMMQPPMVAAEGGKNYRRMLRASVMDPGLFVDSLTLTLLRRILELHTSI